MHAEVLVCSELVRELELSIPTARPLDASLLGCCGAPGPGPGDVTRSILAPGGDVPRDGSMLRVLPAPAQAP
eukprot:1159957-Pelagomonas_calceolata.AAC.3